MKKLFIANIALVAAIVIAGCSNEANEANVEEYARISAAAANSQFQNSPPSDGVTISSRAYSQGKTVVYEFILAIRSDVTESELAVWRAGTRSAVLPAACAALTKDPFFSSGLHFRYRYIDRSGKVFDDFLVNRPACSPTAEQTIESQQPLVAPQPAMEPQAQPSLQEAPLQQPVTMKFQCSGTYTQHTNGTPQQFTLTGVSVEISDSYININGAAVFNGTLTITNKLENGSGFRSAQDETISGFFNRYSGELSLMDRLGPKNADGSFELSANSSLKCQNASPMF